VRNDAPPTDVDQLRSALARLGDLPADQATSLPAAFYTSAAFLQVEQDELLRREWLCIGHQDEVRMPGDYITTEIVGEQLLVTRLADGTVQVLSNVCRHRGNRVADGSGSAKRFSCPYHLWTY